MRLDSNFGAIFALKTTTITAGDGLSGGGDLSANRTITANTKTNGGLTIITDSLAVDTLWNAKFASVTSNLGRFDTIGSKTKTVLVDTSALQMRDTLYMRHSGAGSVRPIVIKPMVDSVIWELLGGSARDSGAFFNLVGKKYAGTAGAGRGGAQLYINRYPQSKFVLGAIDSASNHGPTLTMFGSTGNIILDGAPFNGSDPDPMYGRFIVYDTIAVEQVRSGFSKNADLTFWSAPNANGFAVDYSPPEIRWDNGDNVDNIIQMSADSDKFDYFIKTNHVERFRVSQTGQIGLSTLNPQHLLSLYTTAANNSFCMTATNVNKNTSSLSEASDTSAIDFSFTNTGKPQLDLTSIAGNRIAGFDSLGLVYATDSYVAPLFPTLTKGLFYLNGTDCVVEFSGNKNTGTNQGIADLIFTNQAVTSGTTRIATIQATTAGSLNTGRLVFAVKKAGADANPTTVAAIDSNGSVTLTAAARGSDAFTTTATTDTVTVSGGAATDYYFITLTGTAAPAAADQCTVEALVGKFVLHRSASGTSGLTYNWFRIK